MNPRRPEPAGLAALLLGAVCIGLAPLWVRWSETGPVATAFHRVLLALPALAFWAHRERPTTPGRTWSRADRLWAAAAGTLFAIDLAAWHLSIRWTTVANATLLANLAPVFVTLGAWILLGERAGPRFAGGMTLGFLGAWLLTGASLASNPEQLKGDTLGLITAVFYGGYQLAVARLRRRQPAGRVLLLSSLASVPVLAAISIALQETLLPATPRGWLVLVGLAFTAQVLGQGLITYGFAHLPAGFSSLTLLLQPLVATAAAWALLGETMSPTQGVGALILVAGILLARHSPKPTPAPATVPANSANSVGDIPPRR